MVLNINELKRQSFQAFSVEEWKSSAIVSLKNKSIDSLLKKTYENIILKPLYTKEDLDMTSIEQIPGSCLNTRGFRELGDFRMNWKIAQRLYNRNWDDLHPILSNVLQRGQEALSFDIDGMKDVQQVNLLDIKGVDLSEIPIFLQTKRYFPAIFSKLKQLPNCAQLKGVFGTDIISRGIERAEIITIDQFESWTKLVKEADIHMNGVKTILIDTTPYHNGGANAVQEIAIALAEAVCYIEHFKSENWDPRKTVNKMVFHFSIGGNFFMEIAKLRAFRKLWSTIANAYEICQDEQKVTISAETSTFTKSALDPYVNVLRAGNEAFSAILGGIDYLHVAAFDETYQETNEFSARISRNIQLLLREEAHINKVCDPAGGSYYIETLTNELALKSWKLFKEIDAKGGILNVLESGWLQKEIREILENRMKDIETRSQSLIGSNVYANLSEHVHFPGTFQENICNTELAIKPTRMAAAFEKLREQAVVLEKSGAAPVAGLICLGKLKSHKEKADFVSGFLAAGGIKAIWSNECNSLNEIQKFVEETKYFYYCICGTEESYEQFAIKIAEWFKQQNKYGILDIAGKFSDEKLVELKVSGISGSIYMNQNLIEKLTSLLKLWEVK
ncbi:methylmalonyl-CoA mutase family protein [Heyndrickxia sp. NPDC080065]|uniref:methylmalonyl-CoA mutase family protein n=1 Tax=Heyndrickxia sp. NPDC080065 TaxID=3390568 RepID=UPI003D04AD7F